MNVDCFLDTNVLVYTVLSDPAEGFKREIALELVDRENFAISAQVLQEFHVTVTRKLGHPISPAQSMEWIEQWAVFPCVAIDSELVMIAMELSGRFQISYWDAAILAAATRAGAGIVYSEDLNHRQQYGAVQVLNPFLKDSAVHDGE